MSSWRTNVNEVEPVDFLEILYNKEEESDEEKMSGHELEFVNVKEDKSVKLDIPYEKDEGSDEEKMSGDELELDKDEAYELSPKAPSYSPSSPDRGEGHRDRSRSPIVFNYLSDYDAAGVVRQIYDENGIPRETNDADVFFTPDAHAMNVSPKERERRMRKGVRGRGYPNRSREWSNKWRLGDPLKIIWMSDEDVPFDLVILAKNVMRKRLERLQFAARADSNAGRATTSESEIVDERFDANDGADGLTKLEGQHLHFKWSPMPENFQGQEETFKPERTGSVHIYNSAYDAFRSYWDDDILSLIVTETNLYASKIVSDTFQSEWFPTNIHEILCLFSFWMMLGIVKMPTIASCFSVDPLLKTEVFRRIFSRNRYEFLSRALNFIDSPALNDSNPSNTSAASSSDRVHVLRPIITHLNSRFQSNYILDKNICIDESLTLWKGKLDIKQYIRGKAAKYGIKTFELCESTTGYLWSFIVYTGKESATDLEQSPGLLKSAAIVKKLIGPLLNKGHRLFMDNWYNSPLLARFLKLNGTDFVGTLRSSRTDVPIVVNKAPLKRGEFIARHSGDVSVLAWQDKKRVAMISTCHGSSTALPTVTSRPTSRPVPFKPQVVLDYNKFMGGVDMKDQMLEPYLLERKRGAKWHLKLFKRFLNVSILNARILLESSTQKRQDHLAFRLHLVDSILTHHLSQCPVRRRLLPVFISSGPLGKGRPTASNSDEPPGFIRPTHWPVLLQQTESCVSRNRKFKRRCVVCHRSGRRKETTYRCEACNVPLCIDDCFKNYHTTPNPSIHK